MHPEQAVADSVEGANPQSLRSDVQQATDTPAHFPGGLVGERHRHQTHGRDVMNLNQPGDPMDQNPGLSGSGASQNKHVTIFGRNRLALGLVEFLEEV
jgi:hypothetical protein